MTNLPPKLGQHGAPQDRLPEEVLLQVIKELRKLHDLGQIRYVENAWDRLCEEIQRQPRIPSWDYDDDEDNNVVDGDVDMIGSTDDEDDDSGSDRPGAGASLAEEGEERQEDELAIAAVSTKDSNASDVPLQPNWHRTISALRLVNKTFAATLAPEVFEHIKLYMPIAYGAGPIRLDQLKLFAKSDLTRFVKHLAVDFSGFFLYGDMLGRRALNTFIGKLHNELPTCIRAFTNIETLSLTYIQDAGGLNKNEYYPWLTSHELMSSAIAKILMTDKLKRIKELILVLPCTHDFYSILKHCGIDEFPSLHYSRIAKLFTSLDTLVLHANDRGTADNNIPRAAWQRHRKGTRHSDVLQILGLQHEWSQELVHFTAMAINLTELKIMCGSVVNLDTLTSHSLHRLEQLTVSGAETAAQTLVEIFAFRESKLWRVQLIRTELSSGTWEEVLLELLGLASLKICALASCGYNSRGASRTFRIGNDDDDDDGDVLISTNRQQDLDTLGQLQAQVDMY